MTFATTNLDRDTATAGDAGMSFALSSFLESKGASDPNFVRHQMFSSAPAQAESFETARQKKPSGAFWAQIEQQLSCPDDCLEALQPGEVIYRAGDVKDAVFRIESGAVFVSRHDDHGAVLGARLATTGEIVGLGSLPLHRSSATAVVPTTVARYSREEFDRICSMDPELRRQREEASEQEFNELRQDMVDGAECSSPANRVANFLLASSDLAQFEGYNADLSDDILDFEVLAALMGLDCLVVLTALTELRAAGFLKVDADLRITLLDREAMRHFCETDAEKTHGNGISAHN